MPQTLLTTGSSGLIGSEVVDYFCRLGWQVHGVDNNMRADFFGPPGDTRWNQRRLSAAHKTFQHHELDTRDRQGLSALLLALRPSVVVHTAAYPQPRRRGVHTPGLSRMGPRCWNTIKS